MNVNINITLPRQAVIDLSRKIAELEEALESIQIMSDKKLMAGISKGENDIRAGRFREARNAKDIGKLW